MPKKRSMGIWSDQSTEEYLHLLVAFSSENVGAIPPTQTYLHWIGVIATKCGQTFSLDQIRTKYQRLKKRYNLMWAIKHESGLGWNEEKQTVECAEWKWKDYCKSNKEIRTLKYGLEHYDLHHAIFGSSLATGNYAVPSSDPYFNRHEGDDDYSSGDDEIDACMMDTGLRSGDKRPSSSRGGSVNKKRGKTKVDYMAKIDRMCDIYIADHERDVTSQQSRQTGPVTDLMDQIIEVVTGLLELDNQLMVGGIEFFRVNPDAQSLFLKLPEHLRADYIRRVCS